MTIGVFVSNYQQNWSDFEEIMASKVGVPPLKEQVSENLSMLKVIAELGMLFKHAFFTQI